MGRAENGGVLVGMLRRGRGRGMRMVVGRRGGLMRFLGMRWMGGEEGWNDSGMG